MEGRKLHVSVHALACSHLLHMYMYVCMCKQPVCIMYDQNPLKTCTYMQRTSWETMAGAPELRKGECRISHVLLMCHFTQFQAWLPQ